VKCAAGQIFRIIGSGSASDYATYKALETNTAAPEMLPRDARHRKNQVSTRLNQTAPTIMARIAPTAESAMQKGSQDE
jgi:hypothetical protein